MRKHGETINRFDYLKGQTTKRIDATVSAMQPGKRISVNGNVYWESRANRSDLSKKTRL